MPDASGKFKGISVPSIPWHEDIVRAARVSRSYVVCDEQQASCRCHLPVGHEGAHECSCDGSWHRDADGVFQVVRFPRL